jgi:hypothetical protein
MTTRRLFDAGLPVRLLFCLLLSVAWLMTPARAQNIEDLHELTPPHSGNDDADNACATPAAYAKMGVSEDRMKPLSTMCNQNPDPKITCNTLLIFKLSNRTNPGLVCNS